MMGPEFARGYSALWESAPTKTPPRAWAAAPGRRCTPEMDRRPEPRTRSRQTKLRRGPGSPFCLVEQGYGVCGARDERPHAAQQQQLVDQLGHDVLPRSGSGKTTTGSRHFGSATACGPLGFIVLMRGDHGEPQAPSTGALFGTPARWGLKV